MSDKLYIKDISEYMEIVSFIANSMSSDLGFWGKPWFRGVGRGSAHKLVPSILRPKYKDSEETFVDNEYSIINEFIRKSGLLGQNGLQRESYEEWLYLMQHYGLPTRLLDWTENALVALFFAVSSESIDEDDGPVVWILNPYKLKSKQSKGTSINSTLKYFFTKEDDGKVIDRPVSLTPFYIDNRMRMQNSRFTLHGKDNSAIEDIFKYEEVTNRLVENFRRENARGVNMGISYEMLIKININPKVCRNIKRDLRYCGIDEYAIYPDLSGLAKEIKDFHGRSFIETF